MNVTFFSKKKSTAQISTKNFLENINLGDFSSVVYIRIKKQLINPSYKREKGIMIIHVTK